MAIARMSLARFLQDASLRSRYTAAILKMKTDGYYQVFVDWHADPAVGNVAHNNVSFLGWHRIFIRLFEMELQKADLALQRAANPGFDVNLVISLPWWDYPAMDSANPSHARGRQWRDDFLGGNGDSGASNMVPGGPFRHTNVWPIQRRDPVSLAAPLIGWVARAPGHLTRTMAQSGTRLPSTDEVDHVVNRIPAFDNNYFTFGADGPEDSTSASFRAALEGFAETDAVKSKNESQMHNGVHVWVGGMMGSVPPAPNDPVFWLHHCNIDRIWALWQVRHPALATQYPTDAAIDNVKVNPGPSGFTNPNALKLDEPQTPWDAAGKSWPTPAGGPPLVTDVYTIRDVLNWSAMRAGLGGVQFEGVNARAIGF